jgi:serine/threonine-protein kinase HipA
MIIGEDGFRMSQLTGCVERASTYMLTAAEARELIDHQIDVIERDWSEACDAAALSAADRTFFWHRQFLNDYALEGYG